LSPTCVIDPVSPSYPAAKKSLSTSYGRVVLLVGDGLPGQVAAAVPDEAPLAVPELVPEGAPEVLPEVPDIDPEAVPEDMLPDDVPVAAPEGAPVEPEPVDAPEAVPDAPVLEPEEAPPVFDAQPWWKPIAPRAARGARARHTLVRAERCIEESKRSMETSFM